MEMEMERRVGILKKGTNVFLFWFGYDTWQLLQLCVRRCLNSNNHKLYVGGKMKAVDETLPFRL